MINTLDSIANHPDAKKKISAFVGMEQKTPDKDEVSYPLLRLLKAL